MSMQLKVNMQPLRAKLSREGKEKFDAVIARTDHRVVAKEFLSGQPPDPAENRLQKLYAQLGGKDRVKMEAWLAEEIRLAQVRGMLTGEKTEK